MNEIVLNLDTTKNNIPNPTVMLRQGDSEYQSIRVAVTDNGTPLDVTNAVITFMGTTPAGTKIIDTNVSKTSTVGVFEYTFPNQAGGTDGAFANAYFKITDGDKLGSTGSFNIQVLDSIDMTQAEASDYVSVVDGVISSVKSQVESNIQTATSQLDGTVASAQSTLNTAVQDATEKLNQTINTSNYASQEYVQQTVTSGLNAINKVANAGHADTADSATNAGHATTADSAAKADVVEKLDDNTFYRMGSFYTKGYSFLGGGVETWYTLIHHGSATIEGDLTVGGKINNKQLQLTDRVEIKTSFGFSFFLKRIGPLVICYSYGGYSSDINNWARLGAILPIGYRPSELQYAQTFVGTQNIVFGINTDGSTYNDNVHVAPGPVYLSLVFTTADDMP